MKKLLFIGLFLLSLQANSAEMLLKGTYNGANLYIKNPVSEAGTYCIDHILVNGKYIQAAASSGFNLDIGFLSLNSQVEIKIMHKGDCQPEVVNPDVIAKNDVFRIQEVSINENKISWKAAGEHIYGKYLILKFEYNAWVSQKAVDSQGANQLYEENVTHHSGINRYKIKYISPRGDVSYSEEIQFENQLSKAALNLDAEAKKLYFSREVRFMVMTIEGKVLHMGTAEQASLKQVKRGLYFVNFDNQTQVIEL